MARLRSGILGNIRGKVAGVVGSQWKDKNYLREYIKPANPNTAAQQVQRGYMTEAVAFCKTLVGPIFNSYTDKFQKSMSGFNRFIKTNIALFDGTTDYPSVLISEGKLSIVATFAVTYNNADGETVLTWVKNLGNNGADTDKMFWAIFNDISKLWHFAPAEVDRSVETDTQTLPTGLNPAALHCYILGAQYAGAIVDIISDSVYDVAEAP